MIEQPEAVTIATQIDQTLKGKRIQSAMRGNSPHKWAFYSRPAEEYAAILKGKRITGAAARGSMIVVNVGRSHVLALGGGGERIHYHPPQEPAPAKHQLLLSFDDGSSLSVKVQGWGSCRLLTRRELRSRKWCGDRSLPATDVAFTRQYFTGLFDTLKPDDAASVKFFLISQPGVSGLGNGYLQDILLRARIHPRTRAVRLTGPQRTALYKAVTQTIKRAVKQRGRTDEYDLFGETGGYERMLSASAAGKPCPQCGKAAIVKEAFLGGAIYYCPKCQPPPPRPAKRTKRAAGG